LSREFGVGSRKLCLDFIGFGVIENEQIYNDKSIVAPFDLGNCFKQSFQKQAYDSYQK
jgi:hypothetical protein